MATKKRSDFKWVTLLDFGSESNKRIQAIGYYADGNATKLYAKGVIGKRDGVQQWYETTREYTFFTAQKYVSSRRYTRVLQGRGSIQKSKFQNWDK